MLTNFLPLSQAYIHFRINSFHKILDCWGKPQDKLGIIIWDLILHHRAAQRRVTAGRSLISD